MESSFSEDDEDMFATYLSVWNEEIDAAMRKINDELHFFVILMDMMMMTMMIMIMWW